MSPPLFFACSRDWRAAALQVEAEGVVLGVAPLLTLLLVLRVDGAGLVLRVDGAGLVVRVDGAGLVVRVLSGSRL